MSSELFDLVVLAIVFLFGLLYALGVVAEWLTSRRGPWFPPHYTELYFDAQISPRPREVDEGDERLFEELCA